MGLAQNNKYNFFGKKLPAWVLLAALIAVGAGAATGLVLKDQINGTTTIAVSQALYITGVADSTSGGADAFLGTINDDGQSWAAHFEANNGDALEITLTVGNRGDNTVVGIMTFDEIPAGLTISVSDASATPAADTMVQISPNAWKISFPTAGDIVYIDIAIEDAAATGFYQLDCTIVPVNV